MLGGCINTRWLNGKVLGEAGGLSRLPVERPAVRWVRVPRGLPRAKPPAVPGTLLVTPAWLPPTARLQRRARLVQRRLTRVTGTAVSIPRPEIEGGRKGSAVAHTSQACGAGGCGLVLTSTRRRRALRSSPAPSLCKKGEKGDSASLQAQLGW